MSIESTNPQDLLRFAQTPAGKRDPHLVYDRIRALTPIWRDQDSGMWYLFRWADCYNVLRSRSFGAPYLLQMEPRFERSASLRFLADALSNIDPPLHTKIRSQVQGSFTGPVLKKSDDYIAAVVDQTVAELRGRGRFDVVSDYAAKIPNTVICELLGVPRADHVRFGKWLSVQFKLLAPTPPSAALLDEVDGATQALTDYIEALIEERRREPRTDIISELVKAQETSPEPLTVRQMTVTIAILLAGGSDTTKTAIALGTRQLIEHPDQLERLLADPTLAGSAFEEIVRTTGAVLLANSRKALEAVEIAGQRIAPGEFVVPVLVTANHDPEKFTDPHRFDIGRTPNQHLAFAAGVHVCIGNMMARKVGSRAILSLLQAFPDMKLLDDGRDVNVSLPAMRGLNSLHVASGRTQ
jgi:cytochrome P450